MERLSALDASFLHIENDTTHMHIGCTAVFEGPPPAYDDLLESIKGKLALVPRYRQHIRFVPLGLGRPVWIDDPHFNAGYHLRHTGLPAPGGDAQLRILVGRIMSQKLDRTKPLWEMWMVEGLEDNHWALVSKVHHCMVDGIAGTDLLTVVLDTEPNPPPPVPDTWSPGPEPTDTQILAEALRDRVSQPPEVIRSVRDAAAQPRQIAEHLIDVGRGFASMLHLVRGTPESSLNGPIGPHRRWDWARTTLGEIKQIRSSLGGTVNDVVLAAVTRGFRDLLLHRGEDVTGRVVRSLVPVSVRLPDERGVYNNRVSGVIAELPVGIPGPIERLSAIREQMGKLKESDQAVAAEVLTSLSGFAPPGLLALGARLASRFDRTVNTVTTNVPGPQFPLYASGRRMLEVFPYVPLAAAVRVGVAIFSYDGRLTFGVTGDFDTARDIGVLCRGIEDGISELTKLSV